MKKTNTVENESDVTTTLFWRIKYIHFDFETYTRVNTLHGLNVRNTAKWGFS